MKFGQQLREAMGEMTQDQLAALTGIGQSTISRHIRDDARPTIDLLDAYERALPGLREIRDRDRAAGSSEVLASGT